MRSLKPSDVDVEHSDSNDKDSILALLSSHLDADSDYMNWYLEPPDLVTTISYRVTNVNEVHRHQGWKLHVSGDGLSSLLILERCLPVLLRAAVSFKIVASLALLRSLNAGQFGIEQVGKFITIYPNNDIEAVDIARALAESTSDLTGPAIYSDRAVRKGSIVHYRYGGFRQQFIRTAQGELLPALYTDQHELVPEERVAKYVRPAWITDDPFAMHGLAVVPERLLGSFYLVSLIHVSPRGKVFLGVDLKSLRKCIVKCGRKGHGIDVDGHDSFARLEHEWKILNELSDGRRCPAPYAVFSDDHEVHVVMEYVEGETLEDFLLPMFRKGCLPNVEDVRARAIDLARLLAQLHQRGFLYRDLKPSNIIISSNGRCQLIDLESVARLDGQGPCVGGGTRGYRRPDASEPVIPDDIYSFGALLYWMATGAGPDRSPNPEDLFARPLRALNSSIQPWLEDIVARCVKVNSPFAFQSFEEVLAALSVEPSNVSEHRVEAMEVAQTTPLIAMSGFARRLADAICIDAVPVDSTALGWPDETRRLSLLLNRDLNTGSAGIVLTLCELYSRYGDTHHQSVLRLAVDGLLTEVPGFGSLATTGLYVGEAGVAAALLSAGATLDLPNATKRAIELAHHIADQPYGGPDLFNGTAGRVRFHLLAFAATGDEFQLEAAKAAGEHLLSTVDRKDCFAWWSSNSDVVGKPYVGYAHGASGIADCLLDLYLHTQDERLLDIIRASAMWVRSLALVALDDGTGLEWPAFEGDMGSYAQWCHGAAGVGSLFLHLAEHSLLDGALSAAESAARQVAFGARGAGPCRCHGLAGSVEYLLEMYRSTRKDTYIHYAHSLASLLASFAVEGKHRLSWLSDDGTPLSAGLMTGYSGVALALLRLDDPALHDVLSMRCFQTFRLNRRRKN